MFKLVLDLALNKTLNSRAAAFSFFAFLVYVSIFISGCKSEVKGEFVQSGNSTLRLYDATSGALLDVEGGHIALDIDPTSLNPSEESLLLKLTSQNHSFRLRVLKNKLETDGSFNLNEVELEQPVRVKGKIMADSGTFSLVKLATAKKVSIAIDVFQGFASFERPLGHFSAVLESEVLKFGDTLTKQANL